MTCGLFILDDDLIPRPKNKTNWASKARRDYNFDAIQLFMQKCAWCILIITGESGLVYCGYLQSVSGRDMVAVKTCKGIRTTIIYYCSVVIL